MSGHGESTEPPSDTGLGGALREARLARGESLAAVAAATGISKSLLSLIENDRSDVTLRRLVTLAEHYGTSIVDLLPGRRPRDPIVTRRDERRRIATGGGVDLHLLVPDANRRMLPTVGVFEAGGKSDDWWQYEGEELAVILEGRMLLELQGSEPVELHRGDCVYYEATRPHKWTNLEDGISRILTVATPSAAR